MIAIEPGGFRDVLAAVLILSGALIMGIAALGLVRLADPFMRMHATTKAGVLGSGLVLVGAGVSFGDVWPVVASLAGLIFLLVTSPVASHVLGRAAYTAGAPLHVEDVADALTGVLARNVLDIDPARTARRRTLSLSPQSEATDMALIPLRSTHQTYPSAQADTPPIRHLTAWLMGGPNQSEASRVALDIGAASGATVVALSTLDLGRTISGPMPIGGAFWARWLGEQRRQKMREEAAKALAEFQDIASQRRVTVAARHEEAGFDSVRMAAVGTELFVVPAGIDEAGLPAHFTDEVAERVSKFGIGPVLRVRRRPLEVKRIAVIASNTPNCTRQLIDFIRTGLWRDATFVIIPVGHREETQRVAEALHEALTFHQRNVSTIADPIDVDSTREVIEARFRLIDLVIMGALSNRFGWFGSVREDVHEVAADTVPLTLMP